MPANCNLSFSSRTLTPVSSHLLALSILTLFFAITFAMPLLVGDRVPGDPGDARFNMYVLEHEYQWLTGHPVKFFSPPLFYPFPDTLFFSDTHLGTSFIYATLRLLGFSDYQAFGLWCVTGYFLTFWAAYYVMARLGFGPIECGIAAAIFAFGLPSIAQIGHAQFAYRVGIPFAVFYTFEALERADPSAPLPRSPGSSYRFSLAGI